MISGNSKTERSNAAGGSIIIWLGSSPTWQGDLAHGYASLASVHQKLADTAEALIALRKGREIMATLVTLAPSNAQWKKDLARFDGQIAELEGRALEAGKN